MTEQKELSILHELKISCLAVGIIITKDALNKITNNGKIPISLHEYATTGGVTLKLDDDIYVNAPFNEWYTTNAEAVLSLCQETGKYQIKFRERLFYVDVLPLPGYIDERDSQGNLYTDTVMSHTDRVRISPIHGCTNHCKYCDSSGKEYILRSEKQILEALDHVLEDCVLPVRHVLISGGTPHRKDIPYLCKMYEMIIKYSPLPVDVMLAPFTEDIIERLADWGVWGVSINLEIFDNEIAKRMNPQKSLLGKKEFANHLEKALLLLGPGRVRSMLLVGLETEDSCIKGVEFLASLGCDPVLSPFRPTNGTPLHHSEPFNAETLRRIYLKSVEITKNKNVLLGPRCIPCQHNTLTLPDSNGAYFYH